MQARCGCRATALSLCLLLGALLTGQAQNRTRYPLPTPTVPDALGVNIHFTDPQPGEMEQLAAAGFRWIRMDFGWEGIEREKGHYDFSAYDRLLAALTPHQIRPIFILDYGNDLYQEGSPRNPDARAAFARFAAAAVTHFRNRGILWEMWNEPNIGFWKPTPNVDEYIALALEVGKAIRKAAPEEWYIGPGVSGMDFGFLERCFQAGLLSYWDAVSFHPYRDSPPETAAADFARLRQILAHYAPSGKPVPILSSEWGYSELYSGLSLEKQSKYIARQALSNLANGLVVSIWYDWRDDGVDPKEVEHHFGTVYSDAKPKPTYEAIRQLTRTLDDFTFNKRLALAAPDDYCLLFTKGKEIRLAAWTSAPQAHAVVLPTSQGAFQVVGYLGAASEAQADKDGLRLTLTDAPQYLLPQGDNRLLSLAAAWGSLPPQILAANADSVRAALELAAQGQWPPTAQPPHAYLQIARQGSLDPGVRVPLDLTSESAVESQEAGNKLSNAELLAKQIGPGNSRSEAPYPVRVSLFIEGVGAVGQDTQIVAKDPLRITPMPGTGRALLVRVENLSGTPFTGRIGLTDAPESAKQPLHFREGEKETQVTIPPETTPQDGAALRLTVEEKQQGGWIPVLTTSALRFMPVGNFGKYALDTTPPATDWQVVPDGDPKVASKIVWSVVTPPPGLPGGDGRAARIAYDFAPGWKFLRLAPNGSRTAPLQGKPDALGAWVYGDGSGDLLRARYTDATGQTFQPDAGRIDWTGWRYVTFPLHGDNGGHWGGADDGVVHYPIHLDTVLLVDSPDGRGGKGVLYVTGLTLVYAQ